MIIVMMNYYDHENIQDEQGESPKKYRGSLIESQVVKSRSKRGEIGQKKPQNEPPQQPPNILDRVKKSDGPKDGRRTDKTILGVGSG